MVASVDDMGSTVRHTNCDILLAEESKGRCPTCEKYRKAQKGEVLDEDNHRDMASIMKKHTASKFPEDFFQKIFWDQQLKALSVKNLRSVRWHPLMIKWCLYLQHQSGNFNFLAN